MPPPYRLLDDRGREVLWANEFLDAQRLRQLRSLRAYAFDLLHAARWFQAKRHPWLGLTKPFCCSMSTTNNRPHRNLLLKSRLGYSAVCIVSIMGERFRVNPRFGALTASDCLSVMVVFSEGSLGASIYSVDESRCAPTLIAIPPGGRSGRRRRCKRAAIALA